VFQKFNIQFDSMLVNCDADMLKNFRDKVAVSGIVVLLIGVALLIFTFISAYGFLTQNLAIVASEDLMQTFGDALAPLVAACIHVMYLGVMGWIGSLVTIRGVTIIAQTPNIPTTQAVAPLNKKTEPQPLKPINNNQKAKTEKPQETAKPSEPEIVVIPPEQVPSPQQHSEHKEPQKNNSSSSQSNQ